jgi:hypothetical protein
MIYTIICATLIVAVVYLLRRLSVQRTTIPGIPYHHVSRNTFLGDLPRMLAHGKLYPSTYYFHDQCKEHNTPIMQFWIRPFARPWVVVTDGREGYDVMTRRTKTFDRSRELSKLARSGSLPCLRNSSNCNQVTLSVHMFRAARSPSRLVVTGSTTVAWSATPCCQAFSIMSPRSASQMPCVTLWPSGERRCAWHRTIPLNAAKISILPPQMPFGP